MEQDLDLRELLRLLKKNVLSLLVCALWGALAAFVLCLFVLPTQYQAAATLVVNTAESGQPATDDQLATARQLVNTYAVLLTNDSLLGEMISAHGLDNTVDTMRERVEAKAVDQTQVMRITVRDEDPARALAMLTTMVERAPDVLASAVQTGTAEVVSPPWVDTKPVAPKLGWGLALGAAVGLFLCLLALLAQRLLANHFADEEDVELHLGLPVLGAVPRVEGPRGTEPAEHSGYREAFSFLRAVLRGLPAKGRCRRLLVTSAVPGEGKSAVAAGLAQCLAARDRVLLMDTGLRRPGAPQDSPHGGLAQLLQGEKTFRECVEHLPGEGYWRLPAGDRLDGAADLLDSREMDELLAELNKQFDHIILDTGAVLAAADAALLAPAADGVLLVVGCQKGAARQQAQQALRSLRAAGATLAGAVLNGCGARELDKRSGKTRKHGYSNP